MTEDAVLEARTVRGLLDAVAARTPTPGGGAVAALTAALAAALGRMVLEYSIGRKKLAEHEPRHREALEHLARAADRALDGAARDEVAYAELNALWKLDENDPRRRAGWDDAVGAAIRAPTDVLDLALEILIELEGLLGTTNRMLASDLAMAAILSDAAARSAAWNVRINLPLAAIETRAELEQNVETKLARTRELCARVEKLATES